MEKALDKIYEEMLAVFGEASGYVPSKSCDLAARLYAAAAQIQGLYLQAQWLLDQSFPQTAAGEYLDRHAQLRGIRRSVATCAEGVLRFGVSRAVGGALTIGAVTIMAAMPVGIKACTNPEAFSGGDDEEDDSSLRRRLLDSYLRLPNGANAAYYEQTALSRTGVAAALAVRCPRGVGSVDLYVATDAGIPDQDLLQELNDYLQEKREISVDLRVLAPRPLPVNINVAIQRAGSATFEKARADADAALRSVFTGAMLGKEVTLAFLGNLLYSQESIQNYRFTSPAADLAASPTVLPCLGSVTITEWSGK